MSNISEEEKLAWGDVDFIEESVSFSSTPLDFQDTDKIEISESEKKESPFKLIGRVSGCIAPIDCMSRNGRLYESSHWPKILSNPDLQERIASRKFFGMISHENCPINDRNFKAGEISHICSLLEVRNDDNGKPYLYGELDILDTPAGRILKAMYEGGAGLYVSTRAAGKLLESTRNGKPIKVVDSGSYYINSIDFVLNPGFLQAKPVYEGIKESEEVKVEESKPIQENVKESSEIDELKSQLNKLTKIIEKVVDDVYEVEEASQEQPNNETNEAQLTHENKQEQSKKALAEAVDVLLASKIKKSTLKGILEELVKAKKQIQQ